MPPTVVAPDARSRSIDEMLVDVPIPDGLDVDALRSGDFVSDRYQLGAQVTGAVACGWIESWIDATDRGDPVATARAVDAMATSHDWQILSEMAVDGYFPDAIWELADAMPNDSSMVGGHPVSIREAYGELRTSAGR